MLRQRAPAGGGPASLPSPDSVAPSSTPHGSQDRGHVGRGGPAAITTGVWLAAVGLFFATMFLLGMWEDGEGAGGESGGLAPPPPSPSWCDEVERARAPLPVGLRVTVPCPSMRRAKSAIVCILTAGVPDGKSSRTVFSGTDYVRGAMALGQSLGENLSPGAPVHRLLLVKEGFTLPGGAAARLEGVGWTLGKAPDIQVEGKYVPRFARYKNVYPKLSAIGMGEYECVLLVDADALAVGSIDELMSCAMLEKAGGDGGGGGLRGGPNGAMIDPAFYRAAGALDYYHGSWYHFNTGSILYRPSANELNRVVGLTKDPGFMKRFESDQIFLNTVYPYRTDKGTNVRILDGKSDPRRDWGDVAHLPWEYNAQTHLEYQLPSFWTSHRSDVRILHFTEKKGWQCPETYDAPGGAAGPCKPREDPGCACREGWRWHSYLKKAEERVGNVVAAE